MLEWRGGLLAEGIMRCEHVRSIKDLSSEAANKKNSHRSSGFDDRHRRIEPGLSLNRFLGIVTGRFQNGKLSETKRGIVLF